jgi:hypothetical protein
LKTNSFICIHLLFSSSSKYLRKSPSAKKNNQALLEIIQNHTNATVRKIGQGEAMNIKYKRLELGGGH